MTRTKKTSTAKAAKASTSKAKPRQKTKAVTTPSSVQTDKSYVGRRVANKFDGEMYHGTAHLMCHVNLNNIIQPYSTYLLMRPSCCYFTNRNRIKVHREASSMGNQIRRWRLRGDGNQRAVCCIGLTRWQQQQETQQCREEGNSIPSSPAGCKVIYCFSRYLLLNPLNY